MFQRVPPKFERLLVLSAISDQLEQFKKLQAEIRKNVENCFPVGCRVRVGKNPSEATVKGYHLDDPGSVAVLFENGNIWYKPVESLSLVE